MGMNTIAFFKLGPIVERQSNDIRVEQAWGKGTGDPTQIIDFVSGDDAPQFGCLHCNIDFPRTVGDDDDGTKYGVIVVLCDPCAKRFEDGARVIDKATSRWLINQDQIAVNSARMYGELPDVEPESQEIPAGAVPLPFSKKE